MLKSRIRAFKCAVEGVLLLMREGVHFRIHIAATVLVSSLGLWLGLSHIEWLIIVLTFAVVLGLESLNSSIEYICDLVSPDYNELVKKSKDAAAAAVLIAAFFSVVVALIIFIPKF